MKKCHHGHRLQWQTHNFTTEINAPRLFFLSRHEDERHVHTRGSPMCRIWFTMNGLIANPSAEMTPWFCAVGGRYAFAYIEVTLCSSGSAPLHLFQRWSRSRRLPLPGRAPPSAAPRRCRPWTPTERRLPSAPAYAAAVHSPGRRPRWVYVRMWVKENLSETDDHCLLQSQGTESAGIN